MPLKGVEVGEDLWGAACERVSPWLKVRRNPIEGGVETLFKHVSDCRQVCPVVGRTEPAVFIDECDAGGDGGFEQDVAQRASGCEGPAGGESVPGEEVPGKLVYCGNADEGVGVLVEHEAKYGLSVGPQGDLELVLEESIAHGLFQLFGLVLADEVAQFLHNVAQVGVNGYVSGEEFDCGLLYIALPAPGVLEVLCISRRQRTPEAATPDPRDATYR